MIVELMVVHKKDESASAKTPKRPMLRSRDNEKVRGNENFPLVITDTVGHFDIS